MGSAAYFARTGTDAWLATEHTGGAWASDEQHVAPALGLLTHLVEREVTERRGVGVLVPGRLCFDILGVMPIGPVETSVRLVRPGRTIELVEATMSVAGRAAVVLRAWLLRAGDTTAVAGGATPGLPPPEETPGWDPATVWPGGFIATVELRRTQVEPGRARFWARASVAVTDAEPVGELAAYVGLLDLSNGMTVREDPRRVAFPNLDLTAHLHTRPRGAWVGFDTTVTFGTDGVGLTSSTLHDVHGPVGTSAQVLTVRPG